MPGPNLEQLNSYLKYKEKKQLEKFFLKLELDEMEDDLKIVYIKYISFHDSIDLALVFLDRWEIKQSDLIAELYYLSGSLNEAKSLTSSIKSKYLIADILIGLEDYSKALSVISKEEMDGRWYYYCGRIYSHLNQLGKAKKCLSQGLNYFKKNNDYLMVATLFSNLIVLSSRMQDNSEALNFSNKLTEVLRHSDFKQFPENKSKLLINQGLFLGNLGQSNAALRSIIKSKLVLEHYQNTNDYNRVQLTYAYNIMEIGYVKRAIKTLNQLESLKKFQSFDKFRYLMKAYALLQDETLYLNAKKKAMSFQDPHDSFDVIHFEIDLMEAEFYLYQKISNFEVIKDLTSKYRDEESYFYALSKKNLLTLSFDNIEESLSYHKENNLFKELNQDRILRAFQLFGSKEYGLAVEHLNRVPSESKHKELKDLISNVCLMKLGNKLDFKVLRETSNTMLSLIGEFLHFENENVDNERVSSVLKLNGLLSKFEAFRVKQVSEFFELDIFKEVVVSKNSEKRELNKLELLEIKTNPSFYYIDLEKQEFYIRGVRNIKVLKSEIQTSLIGYLLRSGKKFVTKEELVKNVFQKQIYDPITDDNLVYVNINRLKKTLADKEIIEVKDGCYRVKQENLFLQM